MENTVNIRVSVKGNFYQIDGGVQNQSWDYVGDSMVNDFGFKFTDTEIGVEETLLIFSNFNILNIEPITFANSDITINGNSAIWVNNQPTPFYTDLASNTLSDLFFTLTYGTTSSVESCLDINNNVINVFEFNDDGVIYGDNNITPISPKQSINYNCCISLGYNFDSNLGKCFWKTPCVENAPIKLILNSIGNDNSIFEVSDNENCKLDIELDYLLKLNCDSILTCVGDGSIIEFLSGVTISIGLEVEIDNPILNKAVNVVVNNLFSEETVFLTYLFNGFEILNYLKNINSGLYLEGNNCDILLGKLNSELVNFGTEVNLNSNFLHLKTTISNIQSIKNKKIKLSFIINNQLCGISILVDNIKLNKICEVIKREETFINSNPSFELNRVIDNKKTWVYNDDFENRDYNLLNRETNYDIKHSKLALNTKELETEISIANPIEKDLYGKLIDKNLVDDLIDVKSRKTINSYPRNRFIFDEYLKINSPYFNNNFKYNYNVISNFISTIDNNWVNLIEQVIPSTSIWGSIYKYSNTKYDSSKFKYKKYNLEMCDYEKKLNYVGYNNNVSVLKEFKDSLTGENITESCNTVFIKKINDASIFYGNVTILGGEVSKINSNMIILNEKI